MSNEIGNQQYTRFHFQIFKDDVKKAISADDESLVDRAETTLVIAAFELAESVIGWEKLPIGMIMQICDLTGLLLVDYIDVERYAHHAS